MRYILTIVEQLDRAARELIVDHPINNRLALILIDNAAELILHRRCADHILLDRYLKQLDSKYKKMARGNFLEDKLKVLEFQKDISYRERRFISIAHQYRNELYHIGLTNDDIIRSLSGQYFGLCCRLFERLPPSMRVQSSEDRFTDIAERYLPMHNGQTSFMSVDNDELSRKLLDNVPENIDSLQATLAASARERIERVNSDLVFIVQDNPGNLDQEAVLRNVQWHLDFTRALENEGIDSSWIDPAQSGHVYRVRAMLKKNWRQRHTSIPSSRWLTRVDAIVSASDPLYAMELYQSLRNDMAYLEEAIANAALDLDAWIQLEVDRARGR